MSPQVSTLAVAEGLVAAGGFGGELVVMRLGATPSEPLAYAGRVTNRYWPFTRVCMENVCWVHVCLAGYVLRAGFWALCALCGSAARQGKATQQLLLGQP